MRSEYQAALSAERALQSRVGGLKGQVLDLRGRSIQYNIFQREVDTNRALYDALLQRYKEIGVAGGIGAAPVSIVDRADVPAGPFKPKPLLNALIGLVLGAAAGILAAVGMEFINDTIRTRSDVRNKLGLACLGAIPKRARKVPLLEELEDPSSPTSEAYSTVATSLRFSTEQGVPKTMMVTSARAAEGKSSTAVALAHNFARLGKSVLLIDADLRKPAFRSLSDSKGLTKLLTSEEQIVDHVTATQYEKLWLLACGPVPPNPADLLASGRFRAIIREASNQFEVVIVDAPPVLGLADSPLIASVCGDVVLVVEAGKTRTGAAQEALNRVRATGASILGATLTKSTEERSTYGYSYKYKYGQLRDQTEIVMLAHQPEGAPELIDRRDVLLDPVRVAEWQFLYRPDGNARHFVAVQAGNARDQGVGGFGPRLEDCGHLVRCLDRALPPIDRVARSEHIDAGGEAFLDNGPSNPLRLLGARENAVYRDDAHALRLP